MTSLISDEPSNTKKGRSKRAHLLVTNVIQATENFIHRAGEIAEENAELRNEILQSIDEVRRTGDQMAELSKIFADDPCSKPKREEMIIAARVLLTSVTRLLLLADRVDVQIILKSLTLVEKDLQQMIKATNQEDLMRFYKQYEKDLQELNIHAQRRQQVRLKCERNDFSRMRRFCFRRI